MKAQENARKLKLSDGAVRKLALDPDMPDGKIFFDDDLAGFGVRIYRSGRKIWLYQYRLLAGGRTHKYDIGSTAAFTAAQARNEAKVAAGHVAHKVDPIELRKRAENQHKDNFGELVKDYIEEKRKPIKRGKRPMRPRSLAEIERHLEAHCKPFLHIPIHSITQRHVGDLYEEIAGNAGTGAASHTWSTLRAFMGWAMKKGVIEKNVAALYEGGGTNPPRERTLDDAEIAIVWNACNADQFGDIIKLLILTGARRDEVGHMPLSELDLDNKEWLLPEDRAKNRREHLVPLSETATDLLTDAVETREAFVFGYGTERGFSGWSKAKKALDKRIADAGHKLKHFTLHDLRRSFASGLQRLKIEPHIIEACLNHAPPKLQRVYQTYRYADEKRAALARWAAHIDAIVNGKTIDNVIVLGRTS